MADADPGFSVFDSIDNGSSLGTVGRAAHVKSSVLALTAAETICYRSREMKYKYIIFNIKNTISAEN